MTDISRILQRAEELGIHLIARDGELIIKAEKGKVTPKALEVFRQHKSELVQELTPLCSTCLDSGIETATLDDDYEGSYYCMQHHPGSNQSKQHAVNSRIASQLAQVFPGGCSIHFDRPGYTIQDRAHEIAWEEAARRRAKRKQNQLW